MTNEPPILDFCYKERKVTKFDYLVTPKEWWGERDVYKCQDCGTQQVSSGLEYRLESPKVKMRSRRE